MTFGERLQLVREAQGLDINTASRAAEVPLRTWVNFETLKNTPLKDEMLPTIARVLNCDVAFLTRRSALIDVVPVGANPEALDPASEAKLFAQVRLAMERHLDIEALTPPEERRYAVNPEGFPIEAESKKQVAAVADQVRDIWELGTWTAIPHLTDILEMGGIRVVFVPAAPEFKARAFMVAGDLGLPVIAVNQTLTGDIQRMAMAQAFASFLIKDVTLAMAAHFAGSLLLPAYVMVEELGARRTDIELLELHLIKHKYGVSIKHILARAAILRIITPETHATLIDVMRQNGWLEQEPGKPYPSEQPRQLYRRVMRLQLSNVISVAQGAALLGMPVETWVDHLALEL
jgi:hypothetical protein